MLLNSVKLPSSCMPFAVKVTTASTERALPASSISTRGFTSAFAGSIVVYASPAAGPAVRTSAWATA